MLISREIPETRYAQTAGISFRFIHKILNAIYPRPKVDTLNTLVIVALTNSTLSIGLSMFCLPQAHNNLISELVKNKFEVVESQSFNDEITNQLEILRDKDVRIILANFNETWARRVFCNAYHHGLYGRKFQWVIVGGMYKEGWWKALDKGEAINCTTQQMTMAVSGVIVTSPPPVSSDEDITISKLVIDLDE